MKREMGISRCGLACCLCTENTTCSGCENCVSATTCENRLCSIEKGILGCSDCSEDCTKGILSKIKPYGFTIFVKRYGIEKLLDCLENNENNGIVYHSDGINGDYDEFDNIEDLINFILSGKK